MRIVINSLLLTLICTNLALAITPTDPEKILRVRTESWKYFTQQDGSGYTFDVLRAIYQPLGYSLEIEFCHWRACVLAVMQGRGDLVAGISQADVQISDKLQRPDYPTHFERVAVAFKSKRFPNWQGTADLAGKRIVQHKGFGHEKNINEPVEVIESINNEQAWYLLQSDRADFFVDGLAVLERQAKQYDPNGTLFSIKEIYKSPNYFGFGMDEKAQKLVAEFNEHYPKLYRQGVIPKLQKKWQLRWDIPLVKH